MSRTNLQVITDSLRLVGILGEIDTPSNEDAQEALRRLNDMVLGWERHNGVRLGFYPQTNLASNIPIDDEYFEDVTALLAKKLAPYWGFTLSADAQELARMAWQNLTSEFIVPEDSASMDHVPIGRSLVYNVNDG